jgi:hypothetical protein
MWYPMPILPLNRCQHRFPIPSLPSVLYRNQLKTADTTKDFTRFGTQCQSYHRIGSALASDSILTIELVWHRLPLVTECPRLTKCSSFINGFTGGCTVSKESMPISFLKLLCIMKVVSFDLIMLICNYDVQMLQVRLYV